MPKMQMDNSLIQMVSNPTILQIILILASAIFWTAVYAVVIYRNHKDKTSSMPWMALCLNFSWELIYSIVIPYPEFFTRLGIYFWVVLDLVILFQELKYGREDYNKVLPGMEKFYLPVSLGLLVMMFAFVWSANYQWTTLPDAVGYTAYIMNLMMSLLFITTLFRRQGTTKGISIYIAWCKFLGTVAPTALGLIYLPTRYIFPYALGVACAILDIIYIILVGKHFRDLGINPYSRKPLKNIKTVEQVKVTY